MDKTAENVKKELLTIARDQSSPIATLTRGEKGALVGVLNKMCGSDENRRVVLGWLFSDDDTISEKSSKTLSAGEWLAVWSWVGFWQDDDLVWRTSEDFERQLLAVMSESLRAYSKMKLSEKDDLPEPSELLRVAVADLEGEIVKGDEKDVGVKGLEKARGLIGETSLAKLIDPNIRKKLKEI